MTIEELLEEIHKYDKEKLFKKYGLDLRNIVYLLERRNYIQLKDSIYALSQKYNQKYHNIEAKKDNGDYALKMKDGIENNLKKLGYITNDYKPGLTKEGSEIIQEIYTKVNGNIFNNFELYLEKHVWVTFIISLLGGLDILYRLIVWIINLVKSLFS